MNQETAAVFRLSIESTSIHAASLALQQLEAESDYPDELVVALGRCLSRVMTGRFEKSGGAVYDRNREELLVWMGKAIISILAAHGTPEALAQVGQAATDARFTLHVLETLISRQIIRQTI